jgi:hypothetical protein
MRWPQSSKNDAKNPNLSILVIRLHQGPLSQRLGQSSAAFRTSSHRIVQPREFLAAQGDA